LTQDYLHNAGVPTAIARYFDRLERRETADRARAAEPC
jgi:hypothetical protein